ncbi:MAG: cupin domain-containing protein [Pirellulales bacterium]|nr:cupin domain-containing protein [Pirellulales bacterium]
MKIVFLARSDNTDGEYSVFESTHRPESGAPLHVHHQRHETAYVVEGEFLIRNQDQPVRRIGPGAYLAFPKGLPRAFQCVGTATGKLLFLMQPGGYERFFARVHQVLGSSPSPDLEALRAISKEYDAEIVGPMIEQDG